MCIHGQFFLELDTFLIPLPTSSLSYPQDLTSSSHSSLPEGPLYGYAPYHSHNHQNMERTHPRSLKLLNPELSSYVANCLYICMAYIPYHLHTLHTTLCSTDNQRQKEETCHDTLEKIVTVGKSRVPSLY